MERLRRGRRAVSGGARAGARVSADVRAPDFSCELDGYTAEKSRKKSSERPKSRLYPPTHPLMRRPPRNNLQHTFQTKVFEFSN